MIRGSLLVLLMFAPAFRRQPQTWQKARPEEPHGTLLARSSKGLALCSEKGFEAFTGRILDRT